MSSSASAGGMAGDLSDTSGSLSGVTQLSLHAAAVAAAAAALTALLVAGSPVDRDFFCDDRSLSLPLRRDSLPISWCLAVSLSLCAACALLAELLRCACCCAKHQDEAKPWPGMTSLANAIADRWTEAAGAACTQLLGSLYWLLLGACCTMVLTYSLKLALGEPRPHFLAACSFNRSACVPGRLYRRSQYCLQSPLLVSAACSFPSGHSAFAAFAATFAGLRLRRRLVRTAWRPLVLLLQLLLASLAAWVAASRVADGAHHFVDVVAGAGLGVGVAALAAAEPDESLDSTKDSKGSAVAFGGQRYELINAAFTAS